MKLLNFPCVSFSILSMFFLFGMLSPAHARNSDSLQAHFTVYQCDSLIQANVTNPDFCVMDVRTPAEYTPEHLEAAINRNHNGAGFDSLLNLLPRHKMYVLYCLSGGRSGSTYNKMVAMGFPSVINMLGGITAWKNAGFPTTPGFAPLQMAVSDTIVPDDTVYIGTTDTILLTVTNRANDTLRFISITSLTGTEFSTDFDTTTTLEGPFDYTFSVFYTPVDTLSDVVTFRIESNGGPVQFHITRTGRIPPVGIDQLTIDNLQLTMKNYPNPFSSSTTLEFELEQPGDVEIAIVNQFGKVIDNIVHTGRKGTNRVIWDAEGTPTGVYICRFITGKQVVSGKMVVIK
ncbi:MAG: rhodanese-like domain-containing protein [bacterium]